MSFSSVDTEFTLPEWQTANRLPGEESANRIATVLDNYPPLTAIEICSLAKLRSSQFYNGIEWIKDLLAGEHGEPIVVIQNRYSWASDVVQNRAYELFRIQYVLTTLKRLQTGTQRPGAAKFGQGPIDAMIEVQLDQAILGFEKIKEFAAISAHTDAVIITVGQ